jgi:hypothetical protein
MKRRMMGVLSVTAGAAVVAMRRRAARNAELADHPADPAFMFAMHAAFRRDLDRLDRVSRGARPPSPEVIAGWQLLRRELEFHHAAEDDDLWPALRPRVVTAEEAALVDAMVEEHAQIPAALEAVDAGFGGAQLRPAAQRLRTVVLDHLEHEERGVLPLVTRYLSAADWRRFLHAERDKRRPPERVEFLTWVLDGASPEHEDAVLRQLPPPGRFVYRAFLRPRYERRRLWSSGDLAPSGEATAEPHLVPARSA